MDVDVHLFRSDLQEQQRERVYAARHQVLVSLGDRPLDQAVADEAPVDKDVKGVPVGAMQLGLGDEPVEAQRRAERLPRRLLPGIRPQAELPLCDGIYADELLQQLAAEDLVDALAVRGDGSDVQLRAVLGEQIESLVEIGEAVVRHGAQRVGQLRALGAEELAPGRHVEEQVLHGDRGAGRAGFVAHVAQRAAADFDDSPRVAVLGARRKGDAGNAGNRGQGLAAEA